MRDVHSSRIPYPASRIRDYWASLLPTVRRKSEISMDPVKAIYTGDGRVRIEAGGRAYQADQRVLLDRPGASLCPLEWVAAALGA